MNRRVPLCLATGVLALLLSAAGLAAASVAHAQAAPDPLALQVVSSGHGKVRLRVTAGPSGAPNGFEICWMTSQLFGAYGGVWPASWVAGEGWDDFTGVGTLNTWGQPSVNFKLAPYQVLDVEVGDTSDETGVTGTRMGELSDGTSWVFCALAIGGSGGSNSALSATLSQPTTPQGANCTYTLGYWKTHTPWPTTSLALGTVSYTQAQLQSILNQAVVGNGLIALAHQLIAARLNVANGADASSIASTLAAADALIGSLVVPPVGAGSLSPSSTSATIQSLDDYNNGVIGPGHCTTSTHTSTWGNLKSRYR